MPYTLETVGTMLKRPAHAGHVEFLNTAMQLANKLNDVIGDGMYTGANGLAALAMLLLASADDWPREELRQELQGVIFGLTAATPKPQ